VAARIAKDAQARGANLSNFVSELLRYAKVRGWKGGFDVATETETMERSIAETLASEDMRRSIKERMAGPR
jgi:hypothetical protein